MVDILKEKDLNKPIKRKIQRIKDGAIKVQVAPLAARLVAKGKYIYVDDGPDESFYVGKRHKRISVVETTPSDTIPLAKFPEIKVEGDKDPYQPSRSIRADDITLKTSGRDSSGDPRENRKIIKTSDIPKAKMDYIMKSNASAPVPAATSQDAGALRAIMDKVRSGRK